jgi:hypothetical protein
VLRRNTFRSLLDCGDYDVIAKHAVAIESRTNLLFSFEKMALRDAVKSREGAQAFATGLFQFLHGTGSDQSRFEEWVETIANLPRKQTRVLTWPIATVFGFIAQPERHVFLKPMVTRRAADEYGFAFHVDVLQHAGVRGKGARRSGRPPAPGHDRPAVVHLGAGLGRVRGIGRPLAGPATGAKVSTRTTRTTRTTARTPQTLGLCFGARESRCEPTDSRSVLFSA